MEIWLTLDTLPTWQRVFDFGSISGELTGPGGAVDGYDYIMLALNRGSSFGATRMEFSDEGVPVSTVDTSTSITLGTRHLFIYVWEQTGSNAVQRWYLDGALAAQSTPFAGSLSQINDVNNWLGRSNWTGDSNTDGTYDDFALYNHAMNAMEIQARVFINGPMMTVTTINDAGSGSLRQTVADAPPNTTASVGCGSAGSND